MRGPLHQAMAAGLVAVLLLGVSACTSWHGRAGVLDRPQRTRDQVRLWVGGRSHQVHGVRVFGDSVAVVPFIRPPRCDSCALRFALRDIDSVQVRVFDRDRTTFFAVAMSPLVYLMYVASQIPRT